MEFVVRAVVAGVLVASIPVANRHLGPAVAGVLVLIPAVTLISLFFVWVENGHAAVGDVAVRAMVSLPTVGAFLVTVWWTIRRGIAAPIALLLGLLAWGGVALVTLRFLGTK